MAPNKTKSKIKRLGVRPWRTDSIRAIGLRDHGGIGNNEPALRILVVPVFGAYFRNYIGSGAEQGVGAQGR